MTSSVSHSFQKTASLPYGVGMGSNLNLSICHQIGLRLLGAVSQLIDVTNILIIDFSFTTAPD